MAKTESESLAVKIMQRNTALIKQLQFERYAKYALGLLLCACVLLLQTCKSSDIREIFERCAPGCVSYESPVPIEQVKNALTGAVAVIDELDEGTLTGRWVMLSTNRYAIDESDRKSITDILFTKSMVFTDNGSEIVVSDCFNSESYPLSENGFTIPKDSIFFSSLYFDNQDDIQVNRENNNLLEASWNFSTPQGSESLVEASMYKVSNSDSPSFPLGSINNEDGIYCYSYLHFFTKGEQRFDGQWIQGENEIKEMLLTIDPASGDNNLALGLERNNDDTEYAIIFNQGITGQTYECFGSNTMESSSEDFLSFKGSFSINTPDTSCNSVGGQSFGQKLFSFTAL